MLQFSNYGTRCQTVNNKIVCEEWVSKNWIYCTSNDKHPKQEWSSMESNSYENWDEIEMFFGHLVICNL